MQLLHLDLDELEDLDRHLRTFSRGRRNLFNFRDADHFPGPLSSTRANVLAWLRTQGVTAPIARVTFTGLVRTLGYVFNPIAFYFCHDGAGMATHVVCEVTNTFGERKRYLLTPEQRQGEVFRNRTGKFFYVSPFVELDTEFVFRLSIPGQQLDMRVDSVGAGGPVVETSLTGRRVPIRDRNLLFSLIRYPLLTFQVTAGIHWQALRLWMKGVPVLRKRDGAHLQRDLVTLPVPAPAATSSPRRFSA